MPKAWTAGRKATEGEVPKAGLSKSKYRSAEINRVRLEAARKTIEELEGARKGNGQSA